MMLLTLRLCRHIVVILDVFLFLFLFFFSYAENLIMAKWQRYRLRASLILEQEHEMLVYMTSLTPPLTSFVYTIDNPDIITSFTALL